MNIDDKQSHESNLKNLSSENVHFELIVKDILSGKVVNTHKIEGFAPEEWYNTFYKSH